jgi:hypothetical protein
VGGKTIEHKADKIFGIQLNSATYGVVVPIVLGTSRIAGNIIDYYDFKAIPHTESERTGKGGHTTIKNTSYTYEAAVLFGLAEGPSGGIGKVWANGEKVSGLATLNLTLFNGAHGQAPWSYTQSRHPGKALPYSGLAYAAGVIDLGESGTPPVLNFEYKGLLRESGDGVDVNPADAIQFIIFDELNGVDLGVGNVDDESLERYQKFCKTANLLISVPLTEAKKAYEIINEICEATNTIVFWSQDKLKFVPKCDERLEKDGVVFEPDLTPLYDLGADDFLEANDGQLVSFEREDNAEAYNHVPVEFLNRANSYEKETAEAKIQVDINRRGVRSKSAVDIPYLHTKERAEYVANQLVMESLYGRNKYSFRLGWSHCLLEPGDFVTVYDPVISPEKIPVTIESIEEDEDGALEVVAKGRPPGIYSPARYATHEAERPEIDFNAPPGDAVATIFNPSPEVSGELDTWIAVSGGEIWGGCSVWVSDTGESYQRMGSIDGPSRHGVLTAALPAGDRVDTANALKVELYNDLQLLSGTQEDAENLNTLCWVDGELMAYATATLTGDRQYSLTYLVRGVYNTPIKYHPAGSKFVRLDPHIYKLPFELEQLGKRYFIKLTSRNIHGVAEQGLDDVEPMEYTIETILPPVVANLRVHENTYQLRDGTVLSDIKIMFDRPAYKLLDRYEICYDINSEGWEFAGITVEDNITLKALAQAKTVQFRVLTESTLGLKSPEVVSEVYTVIGKDTPPNNVQGFTVIQQENILKVTVVPPADPDINKYELRMGGLSWETSSYLKQYKDQQTTLDVTQAGTITFWVKTIDNSGNYAAEAASFIAEVHPVSNKYTIHEEHQSGLDWEPVCMFRDRDSWQIDSKEKVGDFEFFADLFDAKLHLCDDAEVILGVVNLGEAVNGNYTETFLSVFPDFLSSDKNYVEVDYRTSYDGEVWSDWLPLVNHQFAGRYVQPKLKPRSVDGEENVSIRSVSVRIDVTAITETIDFVLVPEDEPARIILNHRFFATPMPHLFSYSAIGRQCTHEIVNNIITKDEEGRWYFDVRLWDGATQIAGRIGGSANGY